MKKILSMFLALCMVLTLLPVSAMAAHDTSIMVSDDAPVITKHPVDVAVAVGGNTSFTVAATGTGLTYQWQLYTGSGFTNVVNGDIYSGTTTETLTIMGITAEINAVSNPAKLTLVALPVITAVRGYSGVSANDGFINVQELIICGTSAPNATVELFKNEVSIGIASADGIGEWSFDHTGVMLGEGTYSSLRAPALSG